MFIETSAKAGHNVTIFFLKKKKKKKKKRKNKKNLVFFLGENIIKKDRTSFTWNGEQQPRRK
jgi:hypothetical protein